MSDTAWVIAGVGVSLIFSIAKGTEILALKLSDVRDSLALLREEVKHSIKDGIKEIRR